MVPSVDYTLTLFSGNTSYTPVTARALLISESTAHGIAGTTGSLKQIIMSGTAASAYDAICGVVNADSLGVVYSGVTQDSTQDGVFMIEQPTPITAITGGGSGIKSFECLHVGTISSFPSLKKSSFTPHRFNKQWSYSNAVSQQGYFLGRTVTKARSSMTVAPVSFRVPSAEAEQRVEALLDSMSKRAFYISIETPVRTWMDYGFLASTPQVSYSGKRDYIDVSFTVESAVRR